MALPCWTNQVTRPGYVPKSSGGACRAQECSVKSKDATLIVTTGDLLEISTAVTAAYIQGRAVSLNDRHKRLWEKYKEKYRRGANKS